MQLIFFCLTLLVATCVAMTQPVSVLPTLETDPVPHGDDAADDATVSGWTCGACNNGSVNLDATARVTCIDVP